MEGNKGSILLMTMFTFGMFMIMMIAAIGYVNRQFKQVANQKEIEQGFQVAESGVDYTLFLLRSKTKTIPSLLAGGPITEDVKDPIGQETVGSFTLTFVPANDAPSSDVLSVVSFGRPVNLDVCAAISARLELAANGQFVITQWSHLPKCDLSLVPTAQPSSAPTAVPTPTPTATAVPTSTATPTPTPNPTTVATPTPTPSAAPTTSPSAGSTLVQSTSATRSSTSTPLSPSWASPTSAGNLLVAVMAVRTPGLGALPSAFTPPTGKGWTLAVDQVVDLGTGGGRGKVAIYYIENAASQSGSTGPWTYTGGTYMEGSTSAAVTLLEYSGMSKTNVLDKTASAVSSANGGPHPYTAATTVTSGTTAITSQANELSLAALYVALSSSGTPSNGFTQKVNVTSPLSLTVSDKTLTTVGTSSTSASYSAASPNIGLIATFKMASSSSTSAGPGYPTSNHVTTSPAEASLDDYTKLYAADGVYATETRFSPGDLDTVGMGGFGFSIPSSATITGIVVEVGGVKSSGGSGWNFTDVRLMKAGSFLGTGLKSIGTAIPGTDTLYSVGGPSDLWGTTYTPAQVNAANFGSAFTAGTDGGGATISVDYQRMTIYYSGAQ